MKKSSNTTKNLNYNVCSYYNEDKESLKDYERLWGLHNLELIDETPYSYVLKGNSKLYGQIILKRRRDAKIVKDEYHALIEFNGNGYCKAYEAALEAGVLLEEQIVPGTVLKDLASLDKRLEIFCNLFRGLHKPYTGNYTFPTYLDWVSRISEYMDKLEEFKELASHMRKAKLMCKELFAQYPSNMLLHGDLHHYNILLNSTGSYTIIDPKGVIGHPIFDIPRFILNELEEEITSDLYEKIKYCITIISTRLNFPIDIIKKCFYIEIAMAECWNVEDNQTANIGYVLLAEKILLE